MLADLSLFEATESQTLESRRRTFAEWGRGVTLDAYLDRDSRLDPLEHADGSSVDGTRRLTTWVLAPRGDPKTIEFKCSVETFRRPGLVSYKSKPGKPENVTCYGIASVFTPELQRGKGYAKHMMRLLHWVLAPSTSLGVFPEIWGNPPVPIPGSGNGLFSALYSDVGAEFYKRCGPTGSTDGWVVRGPRGTIFDVARTQELLSQSSLEDWKSLSESEVVELWKADTTHIVDDFVAHPRVRTTFAYLPKDGVAAFQLKRTGFFLNGTPSSPPPLQTWGTRLADTDNYATWTLDIRPPPPTLIITRIRTTAEVFPALLAKTLEVADAAGMKNLEIWNLSDELSDVVLQLGGVTEDREEHLSAFAWYGEQPHEDVDWEFNEK